MAIRKIRVEGDPVLRMKARKVKKINSLVLQVLDDLADTMYASRITGVGLAAPQVGVPQRLIVIDIGQHLYKMINPEILESEGSVVDLEGCLSCPYKYGEVERAGRVVVRYTDDTGKSCRIEGEELMARVLQHEIDHLDGILFIDMARNIVIKEKDIEEEEEAEEDEPGQPPVWQKF
ncbi:MAG: peptide deformylase [Chloroflexi bacterium]|nr:peptide deformylase [Chloroflexota bacterium]